MTTLLVIDNYDSFTYNLVQMFLNYDLDIQVYRSDKISLTQIQKIPPDYIMISPGPKNPDHAGVSKEVIRSLHQTIPILGVCLGMQCINEVFSGQTIRAPLPIHGKTSIICHRHEGLFGQVPSPFKAMRYHSLMAANICSELIITATSQEDNIPMGLSHVNYPLHGVQFHPESFLTDYGFLMVENFLRLGPLSDKLPLISLSSTISGDHG